MIKGMYSIVIPCYKSTEALKKVIELIKDEFDKNGIDKYEVILVNDGSPDNGCTSTFLKKLYDHNQKVIVIELAKNVGQHNATICGMGYAKGEFIISLDDDMQTHPQEIFKLINELDEETDIVYGYYKDKKHSLIRNLFSKINHYTTKIIIGKPLHIKTSSFWIVRSFVKDCVIEYTGKDCFLSGLFIRTTSRIKSVPVKHYEREFGSSNYTLKTLMKLYLRMMSFSIIPLRIASYLGGVFAVIGMVLSLITIISKFINPEVLLGYSSLMGAIYFFSGLILFFLGVLGEYVGKVALYQCKEPQYVVRDIKQREGE